MCVVFFLFTLSHIFLSLYFSFFCFCYIFVLFFFSPFSRLLGQSELRNPVGLSWSFPLCVTCKQLAYFLNHPPKSIFGDTQSKHVWLQSLDQKWRCGYREVSASSTFQPVKAQKRIICVQEEIRWGYVHEKKDKVCVCVWCTTCSKWFRVFMIFID